jgi:hypothetical protein
MSDVHGRMPPLQVPRNVLTWRRAVRAEARARYYIHNITLSRRRRWLPRQVLLLLLHDRPARNAPPPPPSVRRPRSGRMDGLPQPAR